MSNMPHTSEFFWLCAKCCRSMRIAVEKSGEVVLVGRSERQRITPRKSAHVDRELVLVSGESSLS